MRSRSGWSTAASGSSSSSRRGAVISARAERDALPLAAGERRRRAVRAAARAPAIDDDVVEAIASPPKVGCSPHVEMRKERDVLRHVADAALFGRKVRDRRAPSMAIRPLARGRSPAIDSSSDVLPEPDGPTTAVTVRSSRQRTASVKWRERQLDVDARSRREPSPLLRDEQPAQADQHPGHATT